MKKIALFLSFAVLLSCFTVFISCDNNVEEEPTIEEKISDEIRYALSARVSAQNVIYRRNLRYTDHSITITTLEEGKTYKVSGVVYAIENKQRCSAYYSGTVTYNGASAGYYGTTGLYGGNDFDFDIEVGNF